MGRPIIIDTDPGQDDAVAILTALGSPELDVLGLTAVAGNVPLELTTRNALVLAEVAGRPDLPVHAGMAGPADRPLITAEHVHGRTGMDGAARPEPSITARPEHAVDFIIAQLEQHDAVTLCPLGPLTNIAAVIDRRPDLVDRIDEIVLMGGGHFEGGNITPAAEFNIYVDPPAAATVFACGRPIVVMPLDVTHKAITSPERLAAFAAIGNEAGRVVHGMLSFYERFDIERYGQAGGPLHDPCVIAYLLRPELFSGRKCNVEVEVTSPLTMGATVIDWWHGTDRPRNATVMREIDAQGYFDLLTERIATLP